MQTNSEKLQALLSLAESLAPSGVNDEALTASQVIAEAREAVEQEASRQKALDSLVEKSRLVEADISEHETGWFYQWSAATDKADHFTTPNA